MTSGNKQSPSTSSVRNSQLAVYYFAGAALIAFALMSQSTLGNPFIVWSVVLFISACLIFISTPTGRAFVAKCAGLRACFSRNVKKGNKYDDVVENNRC
jgi:multisubunit Na+/H+ antiporter MnhG subunit